MAQFVFREIPFWNIELTVALLCYILATPDLLYISKIANSAVQYSLLVFEIRSFLQPL